MDIIRIYSYKLFQPIAELLDLTAFQMTHDELDKRNKRPALKKSKSLSDFLDAVMQDRKKKVVSKYNKTSLCFELCLTSLSEVLCIFQM